MAKKIFFTKNRILIVAFLCLTLQPGFSALKEDSEISESSVSVSQSEPAERKEPTSLVDGAKKLNFQKPTFFSRVNQEALKEIEKGTPSSITSGIQKIRKPDGEYTEAEKILLNVGAEIIKNVWPKSKVTWELPEITEANSYTGALETASKGVFDSSTGNTDFLSTILPAIVIFKSSADSSVYELSEQAILSALKLNPESVLAHYMLGYLYEKEGKNAESVNYYELAYSADSSVYEIILSYSRQLRINGRLQESQAVLSTLKSDENDLNYLKQTAYLAYETGNLDEAEEFVARVLQQNPNDLDFVLFRAKILAAKNDYIHAVSLLDVFARQNTTSLDYLLLRAKIQLDWSKNTTAATENVEKALQLYPDNLQALLLAARIASLTDAPVAGKYADDLAEMVLKIQPDNQEAMEYALDGLIKRENWKDAYEISSKIAKNGGKVSSDFVLKHVQVCLEYGKKNEALDYAKKMSEENPSDETIQQAYILAYCKTGNRDSVKKYLDGKLADSDVSSKMKSYLYYRRSFLQFTEDSQLADLRSSLISNPRNSDSLFRLYEIYFSREDYRKAQYYLRQVVAINPNDNSARQLNEALTKLIK